MKEENTLISVQLPKELVVAIKEKADSFGLSMTAYIRMVLLNECRKENN